MSKEQPTADPILAEDHFEPRHGLSYLGSREWGCEECHHRWEQV